MTVLRIRCAEGVDRYEVPGSGVEYKSWELPIGFGENHEQASQTLGFYRSNPVHYVTEYSQVKVHYPPGSDLIELHHPGERIPRSEATGVLLVDENSLAQNYFHYLIDSVSRIGSLSNSFSRLIYLLPQHFGIYAKEINLALLPTGGRAEIITPGYSQQFRRMLVPSSRRKGHHQIGSWMVNFLNAQALDRNLLSVVDTPKRIFVDRGARGLRTISNITTIERMLSSRKIQRVNLEKISFIDQVKLFCNAELVVAPHGAGLTNLVFARPRTRIVETFSNAYVSSLFYQISMHRSLEYRFSIGPPETSDQRNPNSRNMFIAPDVLAASLDSF